MPLFHVTVWSKAMGWNKGNVIKVIIVLLRLLFCLGCSDFQFLSISVSAQTKAFIPACDKIHWFKPMSEAHCDV